jgi:hypothetical protein
VDIPPEVREVAPGAIGSATALLFMRDSWKRSVGLFLSGWVSAVILGPHVARTMNAPVEVAGWLTGLFGMAVVAGIFDTWANWDKTAAIRELWRAMARRISGRTTPDTRPGE